MKRAWNFLEVAVGLILLGALALGLAAAFQAVGRNKAAGVAAASPTQCVPTPVLNPTYTGTLTPTPGPSDYGTLPPPAPSVTPLPISKITDLAPDLSNEEKVYVYVHKCNGTYELFLIRPGGATAVISDVVPLQEGDVILNWIQPASMMGHVPPRATTPSPLLTTPTSTPLPSIVAPATSTAPAYPAPGDGTAYPSIP